MRHSYQHILYIVTLALALWCSCLCSAAVPKRKVVKVQSTQIERPKMITEEDSIQLRKDAEKENMSNPMFVDWVYIPRQERVVDSNDQLRLIRQCAFRYIDATAPELYEFHADNLPQYDELSGKMVSKRKSEVQLDTAIKHRPQRGESTFNPLKDPTLSHWWKSMLIQVQGTQNYISPNWYNGGESSLALLGYINAQLKYDDKKIFQWENQLEWKAGLNGVKSDTIHKLRCGDDLLKMNTKLGVKAIKNWYYSASLEASATLFNTYLSNSYERATAPLSPIRFYANVGMDYKYKKIFSAMLSPISYKLVYVNDTTSHPSVTKSVADKMGIPDGQNILHQIGSSVELQFNYNFKSGIGLSSKMKLYTNYKGIEWDWEVLGNFVINRFLSARISVNPRYDSTIKTDGKAKIQLKELTSLGFSYKF